MQTRHVDAISVQDVIPKWKWDLFRADTIVLNAIGNKVLDIFKAWNYGTKSTLYFNQTSKGCRWMGTKSIIC